MGFSELDDDEWLFMCSSSDEAYAAAIARVMPSPARPAARRHVVYRMFNTEGELLYVGMSRNPARRFGDHSARDWFRLVDGITLEWYPTFEAARASELQAIKTERPRYNLMDLPPDACPICTSGETAHIHRHGTRRQ